MIAIKQRCKQTDSFICTGQPREREYYSVSTRQGETLSILYFNITNQVLFNRVTIV